MGSSEVEARLSGEGDDDSEAEQVTARARLRIAELLERPFDIRSLALTGLFISSGFLHNLLPAVGIASDRAGVAVELFTPSDCARTRQDQNSDTSRRRPYPDYAACRNHTGDFSVGDAGRRLAGESAGWLAGAGVQASSNEAIDGRGGEGER